MRVAIDGEPPEGSMRIEIEPPPRIFRARRERSSTGARRFDRRGGGTVAVQCVLLAALLAGCESFGPGRVPGDRFDDNDAIARSAKEQMLANIVRLRYVDFPTVLSVS